MARYSCEVKGKSDTCIKDGINSTELVPGDMVLIPKKKCVLPCDMILLSGQVVMNESMLTGESVPVLKSELPPSERGRVFGNDGESGRFTLFGGTEVLQARDGPVWPAYGLVIGTGFMTTNGTLVREMLFTGQTHGKFNKDSMLFVGFMGLLAIIGNMFTVPIQMRLGVPSEIIFDRTLDLITVAVPPSIPAAMSCGIVFAIARLRKREIFCISPPSINVAGQVKTFIFDKTGTLTEDNLQFKGYYESSKSGQDVKFSDLMTGIDDKDSINTTFAKALAGGSAVIHVNGELVGDPIDFELFKASKWTLKKDQGDGRVSYDTLANFYPSLKN